MVYLGNRRPLPFIVRVMRPQFLQNFYFKFSSVGIAVNALDDLYRNRSFVTSVSIMIQQLHFRISLTLSQVDTG